MPRAAQVEPLSAQLRRACVQMVGKPPARGGFVENGQHFDVPGERICPPAHRSGQLFEDALLLLQRSGLGDGELVAQLHQDLRLHEQRLPRVGSVVHGPRQMRLVLGAHRQHVAVAAHRVVGVAQHRDHLLVLEHLLDPRLDRAVQPAGALAQLAEQGAGAVEQPARGIEGALQLLRQRTQLGKLLRQLEVERSAVGLRKAEPSRRLGSADQPRDLQELLRLERPFALGAAQRGADIDRVGQRQLALVAREQPRFLDPRKPHPCLAGIVARQQRERALAPHRRARARRQLRAQLSPPQLAQRLFVDHTKHRGRGTYPRHGARTTAAPAGGRARPRALPLPGGERRHEAR